MRKLRLWIWGGIALLVVIALVYSLSPQPVLVEQSEVTESSLLVTIREEGITRVKDRYVISAPVSGYMQRVNLEVGDRIEQGETLTELEPLRSDVLDPRRRAEAEARVAAARSALLSAQENAEAAKSDAELALTEYNRKEPLAETGAISQEELSLSRSSLQRAQAILRSSEFAVDVAQYELDAASTALQYSAAQNDSGVLKERVPILSPVYGSILRRYRESEGVVSAGEALLEVGDPAALEVAVDALSADAANIHAGMEVILSNWGGPPLDALVRLVEPVGFTKISALGVEEQRVWVILDIVSPQEEWGTLGDGYRVEAEFLLWQEQQVLQVPASSLFRYEDRWAVYRIEENRAHLTAVNVGQRNGLQAQILSGLSPGQRVVSYPDSELVDGSRVRIR
jgi:HlyD family secretion protein